MATDPATPELLAKLKEAIEEIGWPPENRKSYLDELGLASFKGMSAAGCHELTLQLPLIKRIGDVAKRVDWTEEDRTAWLKAKGVDSFFGLKPDVLSERAESLVQVEMGFDKSGVPKN